MIEVAHETKPTKQKKAEVRRFSMHPKLLMDVITRQAGTLAKAILEGVMNSIDAGAKSCHVSITKDQVTVIDDGAGIKDRSSIERFFETFGQPHDESEGKTYGAFRMGRGQMFAYGKNRWRTGKFEMDVDIKTRGLDYTLHTGPKIDRGCEVVIDLYRQLLPSELLDTERTVSQWVAYAPIPVFVNGESANIDPEDENWSHVTAEAYIRLDNTGSLSVYNLGVHTLDLASYRFGSGGVIVSRQQLKVNFARNDIQSDCPVWGKIKPFVDQRAKEIASQKTTLTDSQRTRFANLIRAGETPDKANELKLFTSVNGRHYSAREIVSKIYRFNRCVTCCVEGDQFGDRIFQQKLAFVLSRETLTRFRVDMDGLLEIVLKLDKWSAAPPWKVVSYQSLRGDLVDEREILDTISEGQRVWLSLANCAISSLLESDTRFRRKIVIGRSNCTDGWTDGSNYVAIDERFLKSLKLNVEGFCHLGLLLLHEICHDSSDMASHIHGAEFYEQFHNQSDRIGNFAARCLSRLPQILQSSGRKLNKLSLRDADAAEKIRRSLAELNPQETPNEEEEHDIETGDDGP